MENTLNNMQLVNSTVTGQRLELKQEVVNSDTLNRLTISGESFLASGYTNACNVIYAHGTSIDAGKVAVSSLASYVRDTEPKILARGSEGVVVELQDGALLNGGRLGRFGLAGSTVVVNTQMYFASEVDVLKVAAGNTATLKDTDAYASYALDMQNATLVLENASLALGSGAVENVVEELTVNNAHGDKNVVVIQTGKNAVEHLNLVKRPVMNSIIRGTGRLENVQMQGGSLEIGTPGGYGSLTIRDVVVKPDNNGAPAVWKFNVNAAGDFNFSGANLAGGTNFSQLKVEGYGNHGQNISVVLDYQNGTVEDLSKKFSRGAVIRLIDMDKGSLSGSCAFDYDNLPEVEEGLAWYTYELFITGELVVVDDALMALAHGLDDSVFDEDDDSVAGAGGDGSNAEDNADSGSKKLSLQDLQEIASDNQELDAARIADSLACAASTTAAFGNAALGHADDIRRWNSNVWFTSYYSCLDRATTGQSSGYDTNTLGYAVGVDTRLRKYNAVVGAALGGSSGTMKPRRGNYYYSGGKVDQDGLQLGLYGRINQLQPEYHEHSFTVEGFISLGQYDCKSRRTGMRNGDSVIACWDETAWAMGVSVSRIYRLHHGLMLTPFAGMEYTTADMDSLREMGYTAFDYSCAQEHRNLALFAGAKVHRVLPLNPRQALIPYARLSFGIDTYRQYARVSSDSVIGSVSEEAAHPGRCSMQLGVGTDWIMGRTWTADIGYALEVRDAAVDQQLHIGASHSF